MVSWLDASKVVAEYLIKRDIVPDDLKGLNLENMAHVIQSNGTQNFYTLLQLNEYYTEAKKWLKKHP